MQARVPHPRPAATHADTQDPNEDRHFHVVITAQGTAVHWQSRVGYYWYLKTKKACEAAGKCDVSRGKETRGRGEGWGEWCGRKVWGTRG